MVDLNAIRHNLARVRSLAPTARVMAVIKANAYGHGLVPVARALQGADSFAVARLGEAVALREAGVRQPLVLLQGVFTAVELDTAVRLGCEPVVHTAEQVALLEQSAVAPAVVWAKLDSGMHRLGFGADEWAASLTRLRRIPGIADVRLLSHFASADLPASFQSDGQLEVLQEALEGQDGAVSLANSPAAFAEDGVLGGALARGNELWLRPGIALYGISPFADRSAGALGLRPAMTLLGRIIGTREIGSGDRVGYGGRFVAPCRMRIGVVPVGYGDGYPRHLPDGAPVLVDGRLTRLVGRVSMDSVVVDLTGMPDSGYGTEVRLWGRGLPVERVAAAAGSIGYELVTRVTERVARRYLGGD